MDATPIIWWPAFVALGFGAVAGLLLVSSLPPRRKQDDPCDQSAAQRADDERELQASLASLAELEERQAQVTPAFFEDEKHRLEARAVALLKRNRQAAPARAPTAPATATAEQMRHSLVLHFFYQRPRLRRAGWALLSALVIGFLTFNLREASQFAPRSEAGAMGAAPMGGQEATSEAELESLKERLQRDANDVSALLRVAHLALRAQQFEEAEAFNKRAMLLAPGSAEGRVHEAMLMAKDGDAAGATARLKEITQQDPGMAEAWFFRGMLGMQSGDTDTMREAFTQFLAVAPDGPQKERVRAMLDRSKT